MSFACLIARGQCGRVAGPHVGAGRREQVRLGPLGGDAPVADDDQVVDETVLDHREDGFKPIWVFDDQVPSNPVSVATFPPPSDKDYLGVGGHFGPHNVHENRPGSFVSEELVFATYQNAGVQVQDIRSTRADRPLRIFAVGLVPWTRTWCSPAPVGVQAVSTVVVVGVRVSRNRSARWRTRVAAAASYDGSEESVNRCSPPG